MLIVAIAWIFVVVVWALAEATAPQGTLLGAFFTLLFYGALPLGIVLYLMGRSARRRAPSATDAAASAPLDSDGGSHPAGASVAPEREEP